MQNFYEIFNLRLKYLGLKIEYISIRASSKLVIFAKSFLDLDDTRALILGFLWKLFQLLVIILCMEECGAAKDPRCSNWQTLALTKWLVGQISQSLGCAKSSLMKMLVWKTKSLRIQCRITTWTKSCLLLKNGGWFLPSFSSFFNSSSLRLKLCWWSWDWLDLRLHS